MHSGPWTHMNTSPEQTWRGRFTTGKFYQDLARCELGIGAQLEIKLMSHRSARSEVLTRFQPICGNKTAARRPFMCEENKNAPWSHQPPTQLINSTSDVGFHFVTSTSSSFYHSRVTFRCIYCHLLTKVLLLESKLTCISFLCFKTNFHAIGFGLTWKPCYRYNNNNSCCKDIKLQHPVSLISFSVEAGCECPFCSVITFHSAFLTKKAWEATRQEH